MPSWASLQPVGIPRHRFAASGGCSPAPWLIPRSLHHPAVPRGATTRAWHSSLPVGTPGFSSRPTPLHPGHAAPIATSHGSATLSVPSCHIPRGDTTQEQAAGQVTGLCSSAEPRVHHLVPCLSFPPSPRGDSARAPRRRQRAEAQTQPPAPFCATSTARHGPSRARIWATSPAGDTSSDTTSTRHALPPPALLPGASITPCPAARGTTRTRPLPGHSRVPAPPDSPAEDHDEVHHVPAVAQVGALVEHEAQSHDLNPSLEAENPDEVRLRLLLPEGNGGTR